MKLASRFENKILVVFFLLLLTTILTGCNPEDNDTSSNLSDSAYSLTSSFYISAKSINSLNNLSSISPYINPVKVPGASPEIYLDKLSALGYLGPIGPYGPLGTLGLIAGNNTWNLSYWFDVLGTWSNWSNIISGSLGENGPLGPNGPISEENYYNSELYEINHFAKHMQAGGVWSALGPIGPLGVLGPLGPLGPLGVHGYEDDYNGNYLDEYNIIIRSVEVPYNESFRSYGLYEHYTESHAKSMDNNDTSFMVSGANNSYYSKDNYSFTSNEDQFVTIMLMPEKQLDDFDLSILDEFGNTLAKSDTSVFVDWIQIKVQKGTKLTAQVKLYYSGHYFSSSYRLFVTGSTQNINQTDITGNHQLSF